MHVTGQKAKRASKPLALCSKNLVNVEYFDKNGCQKQKKESGVPCLLLSILREVYKWREKEKRW